MVGDMITKLKGSSERSIILLFLLMTACFIWIPEKSILLCFLLFSVLVFGLSGFKQDGYFIAMKRYGDVLIGICTFPALSILDGDERHTAADRRGR